MHQPVTFEIPSIGYTIVDNGTNPDAKKAQRQAAVQTARRVAISTIAAIAVIAVGYFAAAGIDDLVQEHRWKADVKTDMASTVAAIDTLDLQNHGNIGFKDNDISCTDTRACFLNADAGIVTTDPLDFGQKIPLHAGDSITIRHFTSDGHATNNYVVIGESVHFRGSCIYSSQTGETSCNLQK